MEEKYELAIEETAMKLGCWGEKPVKKVILHFLEGNDVFVSLYTQIIIMLDPILTPSISFFI